MMANFKKFGVAVAVASALGAAGAAQATTLGAPADALLVPFVFAGANAKGVVTNTLVGVTVGDPNRANPGQFLDLSTVTPPVVGVGTLSPLANKYRSNTDGSRTPYCNADGQLHWFFFDIDSNEVADGVIPVTCEDFVRIDWNFLVKGNGTTAAPGFPSAENVPGYMVIADDRSGSAVPRRDSGLILYGAAYQITGEWKTEAFIPLVPLVDRADGLAGDEVTRSGSFVTNVNPVTAGILLPSPNTITNGFNTSRFSLRYVADPASTTFPTATTMVLWFPDLGYGDKIRQRTNILVFNTEEGAVSAVADLPHELNLVQVDPAGDPKKPKAPHTSVIRDGLRHTESDRAGVTAVGSAVNTGFILFDIKDYYGAIDVVVDGNTITQANTLTTTEGSRAGFAFSMIEVSSSSNVQSELAHERGLVFRP
ncbi:MAG: hypothetical protein JNJ76_00520 [Candidatus Competibacter sp.]|nr:hypothetical protein [Candidatus Competibacter sp.]